MIKEKEIIKYLVFGLIAILFIIALFIIKDILLSIVGGLLLAYIFYPLYKKLYKKIKRKNISATILIFIIIIGIAVPLWFLIPIMIRQSFEAYQYFQNINVNQILQNILPSISQESAISFEIQFNKIISAVITAFMNWLQDILRALPNFLLQLTVFLFVFYFAIRDGEEFKKYFSKLSPLSKQTEKKFAKEFRGITDSVVYGSILVGIVQGAVLGIGLLVLGVENILLICIGAVVLSIIPVVGAWLIWIPVSIIMIVEGNVFGGVALFLWGLLIVSTIDNVIRPIILSKKSATLSTPIGLIGVVGGLYTLGIPGLIIGPLAIAYSLIIIELYKEGKFKELFKN